MLKLSAICLLLVCFSLCLTAAPSLQLSPPSGYVSALPGATVGWGFTLSNPDNDFLLVTGSSFDVGCQGCPGPSPAFGTYSDFIGNEFLVAGPSPESKSLSQSFNNSLQTGIGSFTFALSAPRNTSINGFIEVDYSTYSVDPNSPNFNPILDLITPDAQLYAPAVLNVAPEPPAFALTQVAFLIFVAGLLWRARRKPLPR